MSVNYKQFTAQIKNKLGIDLNLYKEAQMKRRLTSLRNKRGYSSFSTYYQALNDDEVLLKEFIDRITINVSEFYRNPKRWDILTKKIIPVLQTNTDRLRIWSAACSTGEEPYSVAMLLNKHFPALSYDIIATDIDEGALKKAMEGIYQEQALKDLPHNFKERFFTEKDGLYHIDQTLNKNITFKKHNLLADPYPKNIDLLICRNVLIYFTDEAKEIIYKNFSQALTENGILFVGSTEQIFSSHKYNFSLIETFFYQKLLAK